VVSAVTLEQNKTDKALEKLFQTPLTAEEKASSMHTTKEAVETFFAKRTIPDRPTEIDTTKMATKINENETLDGEHFCQEVTKIVNKPSFVNEHTKSRAPLAMLAFAAVVVEKIINKKKIHQHFDGMTFQVPPSKEMYSNPHCHSVVGQQLLCVDWIKVYVSDYKSRLVMVE